MKDVYSKYPKAEKVWSIIATNLGLDYNTILRGIAHHLEYTLGKEKYTATDSDFERSICYTIRDRMMERWNNTQTKYYLENSKRVYYLSLEYLMGRTLTNSLINMNLYDECKKLFTDIGFDLDTLQNFETDAGLGNGGLGRLAACFLDSMATMQIPSTGYGIRYRYGIFNQAIADGYQIEQPDNWREGARPWEIYRKELDFQVNFYGRVNTYTDDQGELVKEWIDTDKIRAIAYDYAIPGYENKTANTLRLWTSRATKDFDLNYFNSGNYEKAVEDKMKTENITMVLYPRDDFSKGKELRLKQEYFFVSATLQDMIRRHFVRNETLDNLADKAAVQMNDTHPSIAVSELMRLLIDIYKYPWEKAWKITHSTLAYTNHTVMPEALEKWPVELLGNLLPRHLEIIYEINNRFLNEVKKKYPGDEEKIKRMSIIEETPVKSIRMANLAIVGSHSVNGVAKLHTKILKEELFKDFDQFFPDKFNNKTNGITPRRWLKLCNPDLSKLITDTIGDKWVTDLFELKKLNKYADNKDFQKKWKNAKLQNKIKLAEYIENKYKIKINLNSIFDCQIKRFHEYKRQLLNILHVIHFYNFIKDNPKTDIVPRTVIFAGKAAPGYFIAKMIIKLINSVADVVNNDPEINDKLKVIFLENYNVSLGELVFPAADLSEQISTAGTEASGTGCMKFALNGALTIGTLDGANIEMMDEIGKDNIFIFGLTKSQIDEEKKNKYNPWNEYNSNPEIKEIIDQIKGGTFSKGDTSLFEPIVRTLLDWGDNYMVLKDFSFYIDAQKKVSEAFRDQDNWTRMSIINSASMGQFSSDRCIYEYATKIWNVKPVCVDDRKKTTVPKPRTKKTK